MHFMPLWVMTQVIRQFIGIIIGMGIDIGIVDMELGDIIGMLFVAKCSCLTYN